MLINCALASVLLVLPQEPVPQAPTTPVTSTEAQPAKAQPQEQDVVALAGLLPKECLAVFSVSATAAHSKELAKTGLGQLLLPSLRFMPMDDMKGEFADTQLSLTDLGAALSHGFSIACPGLQLSGQPKVILVANMADATEKIQTELRSVLETVLTGQTMAPYRKVNEVQVWSGEFAPEQLFFYAFKDQTFFASNDYDELEASLFRAHKSELSSLQNNERYQIFASKAKAEGPALVSFFMKPNTLLDQALSSLPAQFSRKARQILGQLEFHKFSELGTMLRAKDGLIHDYTWISYPEPRTGLLATLMGSDQQVDAELFKSIDADAISATVFHLNFRQLFDDVLALLTTFDPSMTQMAKMLQDDLKQSTEVDLANDVLSVMDHRVLLQEWKLPGQQSRHMAISIGLRDGLRFENALKRLQNTLPVSATSVDGIAAYALANPDPKAKTEMVIATYKGQVFLATSMSAAERMKAVLDDPAGNAEVAVALENLSTMPNAFSWANTRELGKTWLMSLGEEIEEVALAKELANSLAQMQDPMLSAFYQEHEGFVARGSSPIGNPYLSLTLAMGLRVGLNKLSSSALGNSFSQGSTEELTQLMHDIQQAEMDFKSNSSRDVNGNGQGEFGNLDNLVANGFILPNHLGETQGKGCYLWNNHRIKVLLPQSLELREQKFVVVAWPANNMTGEVYALTQNNQLQVNDILAQSEGIVDFDLRDLFAEGEFESELTTGWRSLELSPVTAPSLASVQPHEEASVREAYEHLLRAEAANKANLEILKYLRSPHSGIVARAAFTVRKLKMQQATPQLADLVATHPETLVQQHALYALIAFKDQQSIAASLTALQSSDPTVRGLAATNLGKLKVNNAMEPLLNLLSANPEEDGKDQVAALCALADIGNPACLIPAAAANKSPSKNHGHALAYLFSQLSPQLATKAEVAALLVVLDNDSTLLRRYAIQRLGTLGDHNAVNALEGRLTQENELRPLILVSLDNIRGNKHKTGDGADGSPRLGLSGALQETTARSKSFWNSLQRSQRYMLMGAVAGVLLIIMMMLVLRSHRRRKAEGENWAAMVAPSDDFAGNEPAYEEPYEEVAYEGEAYEDETFAETDLAEGTEEGSEEEPYQEDYDYNEEVGELDILAEGETDSEWNEYGETSEVHDENFFEEEFQDQDNRS